VHGSADLSDARTRMETGSRHPSPPPRISPLADLAPAPACPSTLPPPPRRGSRPPWISRSPQQLISTMPHNLGQPLLYPPPACAPSHTRWKQPAMPLPPQPRSTILGTAPRAGRSSTRICLRRLASTKRGSAEAAEGSGEKEMSSAREEEKKIDAEMRSRRSSRRRRAPRARSPPAASAPPASLATTSRKEVGVAPNPLLFNQLKLLLSCPAWHPRGGERRGDTTGAGDGRRVGVGLVGRRSRTASLLLLPQAYREPGMRTSLSSSFRISSSATCGEAWCWVASASTQAITMSLPRHRSPPT
jgi:hypothetical protein